MRALAAGERRQRCPLSARDERHMDEAMSEQDARSDSREDGSASLRPAARAFAAVFGAVAEDADLAKVADVVVGALTSSLRLESARLYVLEDHGGSRALRLLADSSRHSVLALDMPAVPLDADIPAARVASRGRSEFVEDTHGLRNGGLEQVDGVSRWKLSVGRQANATLPLVVHGRVRGALGMDWSEPHDFGARERAQLEGLALAVALAVSSFGEAAPAAAAPSSSPIATGSDAVLVGRADTAQADVAAGVSSAAFIVKESGALAPGSPVPWGGASVARVSVAWRRDALGDGAAAFWDVFPCGDDGAIAIVLGAIESSVASAHAQAALARAALRSALEIEADVSSVLATLGRRVSEDAPGACWVSASVAMLQERSTVLESFHAGESLSATLRSDGRLVVVEPGSLPLGATVAGALGSRTDLVLPGDRVALCSGGAAAGRASEGSDTVRAALARSAGGDLSHAAAQLLELGQGDGRPAVAVVLDVLEMPEGRR